MATKQNTLTAATNLVGIGSSITALNYNDITLNKPTNFQADWNSTIINKPSTFNPDLTNIYTKTETTNLINAKENPLTFATPLLRTINNITIDLSAFQSNLSFSAPMTKTAINVIIDLSAYQSNLSFSAPMTKTANNITIDLST